MVECIPNTLKLKTKYWEPPRNITSSISRVKTHLGYWKKVAEETAYLVGKEFIWMKNTRAHGEFMDAVVQTGVPLRTAQRLMLHARECDEVNRLLAYHPSKRKATRCRFWNRRPTQRTWKKKNHATNRVHPWNGNSTDCARALLSRYERLVSGRNEGERQEVLIIFNEVAEDANHEFAESKRLMREVRGKLLDFEDED